MAVAARVQYGGPRLLTNDGPSYQEPPKPMQRSGRATIERPAQGRPRAGSRPIGRGRTALRSLFAFLVAFAAIAIWRWEIVSEPPYWDAAMGLFVEADFLVRTGFDYRRLLFEEPRFLEGGTAVYVVSLSPTVLALLMWIVETPATVFFIGHLFTFAWAAALVLLVYELLWRRTGKLGAGLIAVATITAPLVAVQVDMIGMDLPLAVLGLVAARLLAGRRYIASALCAAMAFAIKITGAVLIATLAGYFVLLLMAHARVSFSLRGRRTMWISAGVAMMLVAVQIESAQWRVGAEVSQHERWEIDPALGWESLQQTLRWAPDFVGLFLFALVGSAVAVGVSSARAIRGGTASRTAVQRFIVDNAAAAYCGLIALLVLCALVLAYTIPRYLLLPLTMTYVVAGLLLFATFPRARLLAAALVAGLIVTNVVNANGRLLPPIAVEGTGSTFDSRTGAALERSREYLTDHRQNQQVAELLAGLETDEPVLCGNPFVHFLALPRLGYVSEPQDGYAANTFAPAPFQPAEAILHDCPRSVIVVRSVNRFLPIGHPHLPEPEEGVDEVLASYGDDATLVVYRRRWPATLRRDQLYWKYLEWLWPPQHHYERAAVYAARGWIADAEEEFRQALELWPDYALAHRELGRLLYEAGRLDEAADHLKMAVEYDAADPLAHFSLGRVLLALELPEEAGGAFERTLELAPDHLDALWEMARLNLAAERWQAANERLRRMLRLTPAGPQWLAAADALARLLCETQHRDLRNPTEAVRLAEKVCAATDYRDTTYLDTLAQAYEAAGRNDDAARIRSQIETLETNASD